MNVFEKIIELLEKKMFKAELHDFGWEGQTVYNLLCFGDVVDTVYQVAKEHNNGWIPCSERLPGEPICGEDSYLVQAADVRTPYSAYWNGTEWSSVVDEKIDNVIAWQPLPQAFKEGE